ncbi:ABC transporter permease, partial [Ardenticatena maritima]
MPRIRIERRIEQPAWLTWASPIILIGAALLVGALLLQMAGANPWLVYRRMAETAFGSRYGWSDTTIKATPLILAGLGVSAAFRMGLWNIGAEGQLFLGAFFASGVALHWLPPDTPQPLMLAAMGVAGFV